MDTCSPAVGANGCSPLLRPGDTVGPEEAITPQPPSRCRCGGKDFEFLGLHQRLHRGAPDIPLWSCKACKTTRIGPCMHTQTALLEVKDGKETWLCWVCGIARSIPHKFRSNVGAGFTPAQKEKEELYGIKIYR